MTARESALDARDENVWPHGTLYEDPMSQAEALVWALDCLDAVDEAEAQGSGTVKSTDYARNKERARAALATPAIEPGIDELNPERLARAMYGEKVEPGMSAPHLRARWLAKARRLAIAYRATPADRERPE